MSLLFDGDPCHRCSAIDGGDAGHRCVTMTGIRSLDLAETPVDERLNFQNPFDRVIHFCVCVGREYRRTADETARGGDGVVIIAVV